MTRALAAQAGAQAEEERARAQRIWRESHLQQHVAATHRLSAAQPAAAKTKNTRQQRRGRRLEVHRGVQPNPRAAVTLRQLAIKAGVVTDASRQKRAGLARRQEAAEVAKRVTTPATPIRHYIAPGAVGVRATRPVLCRRWPLQTGKKPLAIWLLRLPDQGGCVLLQRSTLRRASV